MLDKDLLNILVCPLCKADVQEKDGKVLCSKCNKKYPIKNGVPIMLAEEAQD